MFSASLLVAWLVDLYCSAGAAGYTEFPPPLKWHPAYWVAEGLCLRQCDSRCTFGIVILFLAGVAGGLGWAGAIIGLFALAPLPSLILDFARRDSKFRGVDFVFHNPFSPISERPTTVTEDGRQEEIYQMIYLYIPESDLDDLRRYMDNNEFSYLSSKRKAGNLFSAAVDPDFMLVFDSLRLNRFLVHPENETAMQAFVTALRSPGSSTPPPPATNHYTENDGHTDDIPPHIVEGDEYDHVHEDDEGGIVSSGFAAGLSPNGVAKGKGAIMPKTGGGNHQANVDDLDGLDNLAPIE